MVEATFCFVVNISLVWPQGELRPQRLVLFKSEGELKTKYVGGNGRP